jgi:hypothetical protein
MLGLLTQCLYVNERAQLRTLVLFLPPPYLLVLWTQRKSPTARSCSLAAGLGFAVFPLAFVLVPFFMNLTPGVQLAWGVCALAHLLLAHRALRCRKQLASAGTRPRWTMLLPSIYVLGAFIFSNVLDKDSKLDHEWIAKWRIEQINLAAKSYARLYGAYPASLRNLGPGAAHGCLAAALIDERLSLGESPGYQIVYLPGPSAGTAGSRNCPPGVTRYQIQARPLGWGVTGCRSLWSDESSSTRATRSNQPARPSDLPF